MTEWGSQGLIDLNKLDNAILSALEVTYVNELRKRTPKSGHRGEGESTSSKWDVHSIGNFTYMITNPDGEVVTVLEKGRKPGLIEAKNKKFLRFKEPESRVSPKHNPLPGNIAFEQDGYIFSKKVMHPGFEGRQIVKSVFTDKELNQKFENKLTVFIKRIIK